MSRERARRRAEREAAAAAERERRERVAARRRRWAALRSRLLPAREPSGRRPRDSALGRQRSRENGTLAAILVSLNAVVWLLEPSWWVRGSAAALAVLGWPLLVVVLFDRRPTA